MTDAELVRVLKALADPNRFRMVQEIAAGGELSCGEVGEHCPLAQPTISHHLKILMQAGILLVRQESKHHFVSVNRPLLESLGELLPARLAARPKRSRAPSAARKASRRS